MTLAMLCLWLLGVHQTQAQSTGTASTTLYAKMLLREGQADSALAVLNSAIANDSTNVALLLVLAEAQGSARKLKARRTTLAKVLRIEKNAVAANVLLAADFFETKHLDSAAYFATVALANSGRSSAEAYYWLGRIHQQAGRADSALFYFNGAMMLLPTGGGLY